MRSLAILVKEGKIERESMRGFYGQIERPAFHEDLSKNLKLVVTPSELWLRPRRTSPATSATCRAARGSWGIMLSTCE